MNKNLSFSFVVLRRLQISEMVGISEDGGPNDWWNRSYSLKDQHPAWTFYVGFHIYCTPGLASYFTFNVEPNSKISEWTYCVSWFQINFWELFANSAVPMLMKMVLYDMSQWYITNAKILELVFLHFTVFPWIPHLLPSACNVQTGCVEHGLCKWHTWLDGDYRERLQGWLVAEGHDKTSS